MNLFSKFDSTNSEDCIPCGSYLDSQSARYCSTKTKALLAMSVRNVGGKLATPTLITVLVSSFEPLAIKDLPMCADKIKSSEVNSNSCFKAWNRISFPACDLIK